MPEPTTLLTAKGILLCLDVNNRQCVSCGKVFNKEKNLEAHNLFMSNIRWHGLKLNTCILCPEVPHNLVKRDMTKHQYRNCRLEELYCNIYKIKYNTKVKKFIFKKIEDNG